MALRGLLTLVRILGALALGFLLFAWFRLDGPGNGAQARDEQLAAASADGIPATARGATEAPFAPAMRSAIPTPLPVTPTQATLARWIGARYGVAPEAIAPLVAEADSLSRVYRLSPNLVIAVMAIESNFHPYVQSQAGAQGLMQVMPKIHSQRYQKFGGAAAYLDPVVSLRVGAEILRDCIRLKDGSEAEGLRFYFGGGPASDTYIDKVRAEQHKLNLVARGAHVPTAD
ncbi:lytic transglycosylase domain-containing protein [Massilia sp. YMA4]|uniref:lytic transglycosylase domain-containing protein n=1 Tax=Massilia sp. YMA4 TaxID=1593482 RepID=UPI000DD0F4B4|nr:lytic transglycosylase domain-containing protein [Massilia sp. YMA4]AXA90603.1 lytic transglycosylase domain-containing protein [Massilia sp. YMA4]